LTAVAELLNAPVATTINGKGAIAEVHSLSLGVVGANGGRPYAARVLRQADLVLFVGTKVNYVDTDSWQVPSLENPPAILQIDVDPSELGNTYPLAEGMCGDAKLALADLRDAVQETLISPPDRSPWLEVIARDRAAWRARVADAVPKAEGLLNPRWVVQELQRVLPQDTILVADPGTPTPFVSAEYELSQPGRWAISPRAQGGLGYAIPGVVGARLARPELPVVGLCGDGSFAMSAGDLATVARVGGPTVLILFNNGCYGWIKALQNLYHGGRYYSVDFTEEIDYADIARGFGLQGMQIRNPKEFGPAVKEALEDGRPALIEVATTPQHVEIPPVAPWQRVAGAPKGG
jgi:acetolactate synthase-1/2/3 large subunit